MSADYVIVGGGVIGLSIAYRLSERGASVVVLDANHAGQASYAAAGMLAALAENVAPGPFLALALASLRGYEAFVAALREETGDGLAIEGPGMLRVAVTNAEERTLCETFAQQRTIGLPLEWLDGEAVRRLEPGLSPAIQAAVLSPQERHIPPRRLLGALTEACRRRGVTLRGSVNVESFVRQGHRVTGVQTSAGAQAGGAFVVAGGAWTPTIAAGLGFACPVTPVRGQMLALRPSPAARLRHTIYAHRGYLVPREDGQVIVGATEERVGYDTSTTAEGIALLLSLGIRLAPTLADAAFDGAWSGLRPVSPDGLPLLGRAPGWDNVHLATGHGRNGILLTPITGELMAAHLLDNTFLPPAFDPARLDSLR